MGVRLLGRAMLGQLVVAAINWLWQLKRFSGSYYPCCYRLQLFRTATAGCSCTLRNLNRDHFWEKRFRWHNPSLGRRDHDGGEQTTSLDKSESPSKVFMCGVSTQKWPRNQITMFERTRSTLWRHRWQEASEFLCTKTLLFGESWTTKNIAKKTRKCFLRRATNVTFSKICGRRCKKKPVLINQLIKELIRINSWINSN